MDNGVFGQDGQSAQLRVGRELKPEREPVITRRKNRVGKIARVTELRQKNVTVALAKLINQVSLKI